MFNQVHEVNARWVTGQLAVLADIQLLVSAINQECGAVLQACVDRIALLDSDTRAAFCKDQIFCRWLDAMRNMTLAAYEPGAAALRSSDFTSIVGLLQLALAAILKTKFAFMVSPSWPSSVLLPVTGVFFSIPDFAREAATVCTYYPDTSKVVVGGVSSSTSTFALSGWIKIVNDHFEFFDDPTDMEYSIEFDERIDERMWVAGLEAATRFVDADDVGRALVRAFVSYVVPLKQNAPLLNLSFSVKSLPGVVFKSYEPTPYMIAETLVHEGDHQFFYALEAVGDFWRTPADLQPAAFYSPWRDDPRPLDGILRGLSAFARVSQFYAAVLPQVPVSDPDFDVVGAMLLKRLCESEAALGVVVGSKELSEFGVEFVSQVREALSAADSTARELPSYDQWREVAAGAVQERRKRWAGLKP